MTDPALVEQLKEAQAQSIKVVNEMACMKNEHKKMMNKLQEEKAVFVKELNQMKKQAERPKEEYDQAVKKSTALFRKQSRRLS